MNLEPAMLDAGVLTRRVLCEAVSASKRNEFYLSQALYDLMYKRSDQEDIYKVLNHFRSPSTWGKPLPAEKFRDQFVHKLRPYPYKKEFVQDVYSAYLESPLPDTVKNIVLDEWSFLKDKSSIIMAAKHFAGYLYSWGVPLFDAANQFVDAKHALLNPVRGMKFFLGLAIAMSGYIVSNDPRVKKWITTGGVALALFDP